MAMVEGSSGHFTAMTGLTVSQPMSRPSALKPWNSRAEFSRSLSRRCGSAASLRMAAIEVAIEAGEDDAVNM